jgi:hypothetical protein
MALYLRGFCGNPVDNFKFDLWIIMWKIRQVLLQHKMQILGNTKQDPHVEGIASEKK